MLCFLVVGLPYMPKILGANVLYAETFDLLIASTIGSVPVDIFVDIYVNVDFLIDVTS